MAKKLKPVHPGEVLSEDFMKPYGLCMNKLALDLCVPVTAHRPYRRGATRDHRPYSATTGALLQDHRTILAEPADEI